MKKIIAGVVVVLVLGGYWWWSSRSASSMAVVMEPMGTSTTTPAEGNPISTTPPPAGIPSQPVGQYKNGTYTGAVANSVYGPIQVSATVSGGKITDVEFLDYPKSPQHSLDVSNATMPQLKTEAIAVQSAKVNIVSGATQTSEAFQQSLASALTQAQS